MADETFDNGNNAGSVIRGMKPNTKVEGLKSPYGPGGFKVSGPGGIPKHGAGKFLSKTSVEEFSRKIESPSYIEEYIKDRKSFFPSVDFQDPKNFVKFGLAEEYYKKSIENIYKTYPYDGSLKEKLEWHNSSSYIDNYIFDNEYPRTNGYIHFGPKGRINTTPVVNSSDRYVLTSYPQYIVIKGGPHAPSVPTYATGSYDKELSTKEKEQKTGKKIQKEKKTVYVDTCVCSHTPPENTRSGG